MKILAVPHDRNPYQDRLARALAPLGVETTYLLDQGYSHTVQLALLPLAMAVGRRRGARILHLHWTYCFLTPWTYHHRLGRRLSWAWFVVCMTWARWIGLHLVWTAHNVLPHRPVFLDDRAARRWLLRRTSRVIALSPATVAPLEDLGGRDIVVIPPGSDIGQVPDEITREDARAWLGLEADERVLVFVGEIEAYKGVERLLRAMTQLSDDVKLRVLVIGRCRDPELLKVLQTLATEAGPRVITRFEFVPDEELQWYLRSADLAIFPFTAITNSSSAVLALSFGLPLVLPDLDTLRHLPDGAVLRFDGTDDGLRNALIEAASIDARRVKAMSDVAVDFAATHDWGTTAERTRDLYASILSAKHTIAP